MGDSDDDYDRKRRDKFRGERSSGNAGDSYRAERNNDNRGRRDDWQDRNPFRNNRPRPNYGDYRGARDRFSPGREMPPAKRMRPDWGDDLRARFDPYGLYAWGGHDPYAMHGLHGFAGPPLGGHGMGGGSRGGEQSSANDLQTQPAMLTLKQFLDTQDDGISDSEVLKKYSEYKLDFKRQQLNEFFVAHKDEEWFKIKYHPEESLKRKLEVKSFLQKRVDVFNELLDNGTVTSVSLDTTQSEPLIKLLDTVVIKLEGGNDDDLKALDEKPPEIKVPEKKTEDDDVIIVKIKKPDVKPNEDEEDWDANDDEKEKEDVEKKEEEQDANKINEVEPEVVTERKTKKRKRSRSESSDSSSSSSDSSEATDDEKDVEEKKKEEIKEKSVEKEEEEEPMEEGEEKKEPLTPEAEKPEEEINIKSEDVDIPADEDLECEKEDDVQLEKKGDETPNTIDLELDESTSPNLEKEAIKELVTEDTVAISLTPRPRALHRTSSIFLRNLAPTITKAEIEAVCKRFDGYLRVAIADPSLDRRWYRRGWVTFTRDVNIKEICWNLNNIRLRDCEMGAIVNRDLSRRVRPINGVTSHKVIVRNDIKVCAKIIMNLDEKYELWMSESESDKENGQKDVSFGFKSNNRVLQNIADYLIEEASAEEEELLGLSSESKEAGTESETIDRDVTLISVLDKLILYLRVVHSVDFYNHCEYPYEDEMPNRCGIVHARGPAPGNKVGNNEITDYIKTFESKMASFLAKPQVVEEEDLKSLGCKDPDAEVDKFVQANTQELAKDKWLCPLSGKKFKGPEFIKKHIFNKHGEKVDEVRKEVEYYNNYLRDPKRPQLPEHPGASKRTTSESSGGPSGVPGFRGYAPIYPPYGYPPMAMGRGARGFGGRGRRPRVRQGYTYRDWDAPTDEDDEFLF